MKKSEKDKSILEGNFKKLEELFDCVGSMTKVGGWKLDLQSGKLFWSRETYRIHEADPQIEPTVAAALSYYSSDVKSKLEAMVQAAIEQCTPWDYELPMTTAKGRNIWVRGQGIAIRENGKTVTLIGAFQEITERKEAEQALRESENIFNQFMSNSPVLVYIKDEKQRLIKFSANFENLLGRPAGELLGKDSFEFFPPEFAKRAIADDLKTLHNGTSVKSEEILNGRTYSTIKFPIHRATGKPDYLGGFSIDITEQKEAVEILAESETKYKSLYEAAGIGIGYYSADGIILGYNRLAASHMNGLPEDFIGKSIYDVFPQKAAEFYHNRIKLAAQSDQPTEYEDSVSLPLGEKIFLSTFTKVTNSKNEILGIQIISQDITKLKENEAIREKVNDKLNQIQKLESLGLLAGGIAHDFNNLLGGIFGFIDLANEETDAKKISSYLSRAMTTIDRARALTTQLLTFAKGGAPIQKIGQLFPFVEETTKFALSGSNVSCSFEVPQDLWACNFDKNQIGQVIDNLVINAQQAMPFGGTIELTARNTTLAEKEIPHLPKGNYVKISVKDHGIGMARELLPRIFDPFFTTKSKGHGLGLATCFSIINRHDGAIDVESEPGKGSTFHVYLPASTDTVSTTSDISATVHNGSGTFLIMDDEEVIRETIQRMLASFGYTVICTENGKEAVDFYTAEIAAKRTFAGMILILRCRATWEGERRWRKSGN